MQALHRSTRVTRRTVCAGLVGTAIVPLLAACGVQPPSQPPATVKPAEPTKPAEAPKAAAPPTAQPAPTSAPPIAAPTTAAAKPAAKLGEQLIGKLEGPEIIVDQARIPKRFNEAPMLAD